jgi:HAD superfamily hydrolase (TIGR01509 family)
VLRILRDRGVILEPSDLDRFIGISSSVMWEEMRERFGLVESVKTLKNLQNRANVEMLECSESILIPGVLPLLRDLRTLGIRTAVASSSTRKYIEMVLAKYELERLFDIIVSGEEVPRGKPRPDVFLKAAELLGVEPGSCVVIEDSDNGLTAAREAEIRSIGFRNPNSGRQTLSLADRIVDDIREVSIVLLKSLVDSESAA